LRYAAEGAHVVCSDLRPGTTKDGSEVTATHNLISEKGGRSIFVSADVGDEKSVQGLVKAATQEFGRLDMYVNRI
jgi:NAD(P)-dependent dehydrogenase (short-subunit alcohol dehydrogenase family)